MIPNIDDVPEHLRPTVTVVDPETDNNTNSYHSVPNQNTNDQYRTPRQKYLLSIGVTNSASTNSVQKSINDKHVMDGEKINDSINSIMDIFGGPRPSSKKPETTVPASTNNNYSVPNNATNAAPIKIEDKIDDKKQNKTNTKKVYGIYLDQTKEKITCLKMQLGEALNQQM